MEEQNDFVKMIEDLTNKNTRERAQSITDNKIRIFNIDKENKLVEAELQGTNISPYKIIINLAIENPKKIIYHDCPDYLARKKLNNKFCKHLTKLIIFLRKEDPPFALNLLQEIHKKLSINSQVRLRKSPDFNQFFNEDLENQLEFKYKGFDYFFDFLEISNSGRSCLKELLMEAKKLPAALRGFHGGYEGGLFDHILLVTNYVYELSKSSKSQVNIQKAVLTAIYHDFGKISYYSYKRRQQHSYVISDREELDKIHENIQKKYKYFGRDYHVEEALAVLKRNDKVLFNDDEISKAIIFHHGQWSKYYPIDMTELASLIHKADMIASQTHYV